MDQNTACIRLQPSTSLRRADAIPAVSFQKLAFTLRATSTAELAQRVETVQSALRQRGGSILWLRWSYSARTEMHTAAVHYQVPAPLV